jgi:hypothetical protein
MVLYQDMCKKMNLKSNEVYKWKLVAGVTFFFFL